MATHTIGIIVNGATGRIGSTQHLANALIPIIDEGGLALGADRVVRRRLLLTATPIALAGKRSCATLRPPRRLHATSRPAFATSPSPKPAIAACRSALGLRSRQRRRARRE
jgi:hypothetical protein